MIDFQQLLTALYEIQGLSDPNNSDDPQDVKERVAEIYEKTSHLVKESGYNPD